MKRKSFEVGSDKEENRKGREKGRMKGIRNGKGREVKLE